MICRKYGDLLHDFDLTKKVKYFRGFFLFLFCFLFLFFFFFFFFFLGGGGVHKWSGQSEKQA